MFIFIVLTSKQFFVSFNNSWRKKLTIDFKMVISVKITSKEENKNSTLLFNHSCHVVGNQNDNTGRLVGAI